LEKKLAEREGRSSLRRLLKKPPSNQGKKAVRRHKNHSYRRLIWGSLLWKTQRKRGDNKAEKEKGMTW